MTVEELREICLQLKGVTEDIKWEDHLCFSVGGKMFLVCSPDNVPPSASIKVSNEDFELLTSRSGIIPAPYLARNKWIYLADISTFSRKQWSSYIEAAYKIIGSKLPKKLQMAFEIIQPPEQKASHKRTSAKKR